MRIGKAKITQALNYVRQDIGDDFWPDILEYKDYFENPDVLLTQKYDNYIQGPAIPMDIPKQTLVLRPGHFLALKDRLYYQILVNEFAYGVDKKLVDWSVSFAHRLSTDKKYFLSPRDNIESWKLMNRKTEKYFNKNKDGFLLKTDINAYFEHIKIKKLIEILVQFRVNKEITNNLSSLLNGWANGEEIGIPQGNNCSSFLGNIYLHEVDEAMISLGFNYYRFADDIKVFADSEIEIRGALAKLTELLRPLNLHLNGGKTKILRSSEYFSESNKFSEEMEAVSYSLKWGAEDIDVEETTKYLKTIWNGAVNKKSILNKTAFNFAIYRLPKVKSDVPVNFLLNSNLADPSFSPKTTEFLSEYVYRKRVQNVLLDVLNSSVYDYQKIYLLRCLIKAQKIKFDVTEVDKEKIYRSNNFMLIGYYLVFMSKFGNYGVKMALKSEFNSKFKSDEKIARYFTVALQHFPNSKKEMSELLRIIPSLANTVHYLTK